MAKYEELGYCPCNEFYHVSIRKMGEGTLSKNWQEVQELLGSRMAYMVYPKGSSNHKGSYIVDCLVGDKDGDVSIKIATALCMLIPQCDYPYIGKRIECADIINVYQMPVELTNKDGYYMLSRKEDMDYNFVFEDKRYVILIRDLEEKVAIYLYKK